MDPEVMDRMITHVRLVINEGKATVSEVSKDDHEYPIYSLDEQGKTQSTGNLDLQRDAAIQASRDLHVPLLTLDRDLIRKISEVRQKLAVVVSPPVPHTTSGS